MIRITIIYSIFVLFCSCSIKPQIVKTKSKYAKYDIDHGKIVYELKNSKSSKTKVVSLEFSNFGAVEEFEGDLFENNFERVIKKDSVQIIVNSNNERFEEPRTPQFMFELFVLDNESLLFQGLRVAKSSKKIFLKKNCTHYYHFDFGDKNNLIGSVTFYKQIPVRIKLIKGDIYYSIHAIKIE